MGLTQTERIRTIVYWLSGQTGKPLHKIGRELGYNNRSAFSQVLNGPKAVPKDFPERVAALDPRINIDYLTGASDEMFVDANNAQETAPESHEIAQVDKSPIRREKRAENGIFVPSELVQMISDLSATIKDQQRIITTLVETWAKRQ